MSANASKVSTVSILSDEKCIIVDGEPCQCKFVLPVGVKSIKWDIDYGGHLIYADEAQHYSVDIENMEKIDNFYDTYIEPYIELYYKEKDRLKMLQDEKNKYDILNKHIRKKKYEITKKYKLAVYEYLGDYTAEELALFPQLYEGALSFILNETEGESIYNEKESENVKLLMTIAHSKNAKVIDVAHDVIDTYKKYTNIVGQLIGQKQKYFDQIKQLGMDTTIENIDSISIKFEII